MATNFAQATYTEVIDLQTTADQQSIIGIHTPTGISPYQRLKGFFTQFRKYRYNGIKSLVMVPAANLPVDPLGLTGIVGTTDLMDPRDTLNPILFHGCHGEYLDMILNQIYSQAPFVGPDNEPLTAPTDGSETSPSADKYEVSNTAHLYSYYSKLTDSSWRKFGIQSGVKLTGLRPLVHTLVQNMPTLPSAAANGNAAGYYRNTGLFQGIDAGGNELAPGTAVGNSPYNDAASPMRTIDSVYTYDGSSPSIQMAYKQQFTNRMTSLGWLPTVTLQNPVDGSAGGITMLPKCFMGVLVMPPAYNVEQFFRMVITHSFSFKDFTSSLDAMDYFSFKPSLDQDDALPYRNWIDYGSEGSKVAEGTTLDMIGGKSEVVSDGVM